MMKYLRRKLKYTIPILMLVFAAACGNSGNVSNSVKKSFLEEFGLDIEKKEVVIT